PCGRRGARDSRAGGGGWARRGRLWRSLPDAGRGERGPRCATLLGWRCARRGEERARVAAPQRRSSGMAGRLDGKAAIVTGAGRGNGRGIARVFGAEGAKVLVVDRDAEPAAETVSAIAAAGGTASAFQADVSVAAQVEAAVAAAVERYGRIDVLCCNAGIFPAATLDRMTEAEWDRVLTVNLKSVFLAVRACLPRMREQRSGRIVITSSITGPRVAIPGLTHYAASKAGINGFIRAAALELAPHGITINGVEPGSVRTPGFMSLNNEADAEATAQAIPLKKLAEPEDIGYAMLFLASDEARYITGQTIVVDGGQILPEVPSAVL